MDVLQPICRFWQHQIRFVMHHEDSQVAKSEVQSQGSHAMACCAQHHAFWSPVHSFSHNAAPVAQSYCNAVECGADMLGCGMLGGVVVGGGTLSRGMAGQPRCLLLQHHTCFLTHQDVSQVARSSLQSQGSHPTLCVEQHQAFLLLGQPISHAAAPSEQSKSAEGGGAGVVHWASVSGHAPQTLHWDSNADRACSQALGIPTKSLLVTNWMSSRQEPASPL